MSVGAQMIGSVEQTPSNDLESLVRDGQ